MPVAVHGAEKYFLLTLSSKLEGQCFVITKTTEKCMFCIRGQREDTAFMSLTSSRHHNICSVSFSFSFQWWMFLQRNGANDFGKFSRAHIMSSLHYASSECVKRLVGKWYSTGWQDRVETLTLFYYTTLFVSFSFHLHRVLHNNMFSNFL